MGKKIVIHIRSEAVNRDETMTLQDDSDRVFAHNYHPATHFIEVWGVDGQINQTPEPFFIAGLRPIEGITIAIFKIRFHK